MSDGVDDIRQFAISIGRIADSAFSEIDAVISKGALNIKNEMIADIKTSRHFVGKRGPGLESSITYDAENARGLSRRVIGPDKERPGGALGNIYYFGTSRGGGSGDIEKPMNSEEPRVLSAMNALVARWAGRL